MSEIKLQMPLVGVKMFDSYQPGWSDVPVYFGTSYCHAISRAAHGEELLLLANSISLCQWSPIILGLKKPENSFEKRLQPRVDQLWGIYLAPLARFSTRPIEPDIVIIRDKPHVLKQLFSQLGWARTVSCYEGQMDKSTISILKNGKFSLKVLLIKGSNQLLYLPQDRKWWAKATAFIFRSTLVCSIFDRLISFFAADMSLCRNSTIIPYLKGGANASFFCSGGIVWGGNHPAQMTSGFPYALFRKLENKLGLK